MALLSSPPKPRVWNLPNQLTASRFVLALVLFALIAYQLWLGCLIVFVVAAFTDWLDGYLARKQNLTSTLGRILDPLVDKVLMCGVYICLLPIGVQEGWLWPSMVTVVVARELVITGLRSWIESHGARFGADWLGKFKMGLQCAAVIAVFVAFLAPEYVGSASGFFDVVRNMLIWAMTIVTLLSGLQYMWKAAMLLNA
jgi:CDP-diacylglycerol---glycerol-3-phosphate 3-phosphatidyltransferase